ncbi:radial spoke head 1 homolog [Montipora foliosa]|uniref:radial spoke head 1 homolog n=1 Tax=Montipora foliosa TaxID=591990 RepID=UPI0035F12808
MSFSVVGSEVSLEGAKYLGTYEGERNENEERHGHGKALLPNGDEYEGGYQNGKRSGSGIYTFVSKRARYEGEYVKGLKDGKGTFSYPDGSVYEGSWVNGKREGLGEYRYANGDTYIGNWKADRRHGEGEYIYKDKGIKYKGNWNDGKFEHEGHLITSTYTYSGTFNGEQPVGAGRFHFDTGCEQDGEYVTKRMVLRTKASREVVHLPVWRCLALYEAGLRHLR